MVKPGIKTDQSAWRLGIETTAEILQNRIGIYLKEEKIKYGLKLRGKIDTRKMSITGVETRMKEIKKAKIHDYYL